MTRARRVGMWAALLVAASGATGAVAGCAGHGGAAGPGATVIKPAPSPAPGELGLSSSGSAHVPPTRAATAPALANTAGGASATAALPSAVIKTASLRVSVAHGDLRDALDRAQQIAQQQGGYVTSSSTATSGHPTGVVVLRVPAARFTAAVTMLERVGRVHAEHITGRDVSQQFVDLNARLVNLQAQEHVLLRLMSRARTINQSIEVENQLSQVELQIEDLTGSVRYLRNRSDLSTITLTVAAAGPPPPVHQHATALWKAAARACSLPRRAGGGDRGRRVRAPDRDPAGHRAGGRAPPLAALPPEPGYGVAGGSVSALACPAQRIDRRRGAQDGDRKAARERGRHRHAHE